MSNLSRFISDRFLGLMGGDENERQAIVTAIETGNNSLSNILPGTNISLSLVNGQLTINASGGGGSTWGSITGTLSDQTDLQSALDAKQSAGNYASQDLSNLISTSIPQNLTPATSNTYVLGRSDGLMWSKGFITDLYDSAPSRSIAVEGRALYDGSNNKMFDWGGELNANSHEFINLLDPTSPQSAATQNYVDNKILVFTSTATTGGAAAEAVTVTGLLSTDTVLSVSPKTNGGANVPFVGWDTQINGGITVHYTADMGPGAVVLVAVKR